MDDLHNDYNTSSQEISYQEYLNNIIKTNQEKPIIFVGLDSELCLGSLEDSDIMYELDAKYKFYIETSDSTLKQRFFRQLDKLEKLEKRKEWFFDEWKKNPEKIQEKIFRFVDLNKWKENNEKCDELYKKRDYKFMNQDDIFNKVCDILDK